MKRFPMEPIDAAWWRMDSATNRMTIVAVLRFDEPFFADEFKQLLRSRLSELPRFQQRVTLVRGRPYWELDPDFSYSNHVGAVTENVPTDEDSLKLFVGEAMSAPHPANRPPWYFSVIEHFEGGSVVVARLHHAIADGLALIRVLQSLADDAEPIPMEAVPMAEPLKRGLRGWAHNLVGAAAAIGKFAFPLLDPSVAANWASRRGSTGRSRSKFGRCENRLSPIRPPSTTYLWLFSREA